MVSSSIEINEANVKIDLKKYLVLDEFTASKENDKYGTYLYKFNDKGLERYSDFIQDLEEYAKNGSYGATKWESVWIEDFSINEQLDGKDWRVELYTDKDVGLPNTLQDFKEHTDFDECRVWATWKAIREESLGRGSWWRISVYIPIGDILYLDKRQVQKRVEMGDYDRNMD